MNTITTASHRLAPGSAARPHGISPPSTPWLHVPQRSVADA